VISLILSFKSSVILLILLVAPSSFASSRRESWMSIAITVVHPSIMAAIIAPRPTAPVPNTAIEEFALGFSPFVTVPAPVAIHSQVDQRDVNQHHHQLLLCCLRSLEHGWQRNFERKY